VLRVTKCILPLWEIPSTIDNIARNRWIDFLVEGETVLEIGLIGDGVVNGTSSCVLTRFGIGWLVSEELK